MELTVERTLIKNWNKVKNICIMNKDGLNLIYIDTNSITIQQAILFTGQEILDAINFILINTGDDNVLCIQILDF